MIHIAGHVMEWTFYLIGALLMIAMASLPLWGDR